MSGEVKFAGVADSLYKAIHLSAKKLSFLFGPAQRWD